MKTMLIAARANSEAMAKLFRAELPDHEIVTVAPINRPVAYAVVGKPQPGTISGLPGLELVLSLNAGVEHLLSSGEVPSAVPIVRMVDPGLVDGMVEWVTAQVLAWHRNLFVYHAQQAAGEWTTHAELMARERTVTVLGAGALGAPVAAMLAAIRFNVRTWSRSGRSIAGIDSFGGDGLAAAVAGADVLVNLLPATAETIDLIDAVLLDRLAPGAMLVNGGRGATVIDADLVGALDKGQLSWAVPDVLAAKFAVARLPANTRVRDHVRCGLRRNS